MFYCAGESNPTFGMLGQCADHCTTASQLLFFVITFLTATQASRHYTREWSRPQATSIPNNKVENFQKKEQKYFTVEGN